MIERALERPLERALQSTVERQSGDAPSPSVGALDLVLNGEPLQLNGETLTLGEE